MTHGLLDVTPKIAAEHEYRSAQGYFDVATPLLEIRQ
jgi:hypothetical protein